ncbi:MAG: AAA family ATPase [bacterium]|nr:AAA family ATPase [bacterium]
MKTIYIIGGTMGAGKTAVCQNLKMKLNNSVFLDGDWCWDMHPFQVTDETKAMVVGNICHILNSFLSCSAFENIIFCWVMHEQSIINNIVSQLDLSDCRIINISLICTEDALRKHLQKDVDNGIRTADVIDRSIARIPLYEKLNTVKIDVSGKSVDAVADKIKQL